MGNRLQDLKGKVIDVVGQAYEDGDLEKDEDAVIRAIVNTAIPTDSSVLLEIAARNPDLATEKPKQYGFDGSHTAVNAIAGNLFSELKQEAYTVVQVNTRTLRNRR